ncbi:MAG: hypothetical protein CL424_11185 [Acidimicrobiaceae bacterium]|nr:hypothetical protein [Acidimicrobiaceae bacterium]
MSRQAENVENRCHCGGDHKPFALVTTTDAALHLGVSWRTFEKRRKAGEPLYQPDHTDPDSGRRTYDPMRMDAQRRRAGELVAERAERPT